MIAAISLNTIGTAADRSGDGVFNTNFIPRRVIENTAPVITNECYICAVCNGHCAIGPDAVGCADGRQTSGATDYDGSQCADNGASGCGCDLVCGVLCKDDSVLLIKIMLTANTTTPDRCSVQGNGGCCRIILDLVIAFMGTLTGDHAGFFVTEPIGNIVSVYNARSGNGEFHAGCQRRCGQQSDEHHDAQQNAYYALLHHFFSPLHILVCGRRPA